MQELLFSLKDAAPEALAVSARFPSWVMQLCIQVHTFATVIKLSNLGFILGMMILESHISDTVIGSLTSLRELRVPGNKLSSLPREIGSLVNLQRLVADSNLITTMPGENQGCS